MSARNIYRDAIWILVILFPIMLLLVYDVCCYSVGVIIRYRLSGESRMIDKMSAVVENDNTLAAFHIRDVRTGEGVLTKQKQFKKIRLNDYGNEFEFLLFDYKSKKVFKIGVYEVNSPLKCNELLLLGTATINDYYKRTQQLDSIPISKRFYVTPICGVLSSYKNSINNREIFEGRLLKRMGLEYSSYYDNQYDRGFLSEYLFSDYGSKRWFEARFILISAFICDIIFLGLAIFLELRQVKRINKKMQSNYDFYSKSHNRRG